MNRSEVFKEQADGRFAHVVTTGESDAQGLKEALNMIGADPKISPFINAEMPGYEVSVPADDFTLLQAVGFEVKRNLPSPKGEFTSAKNAVGTSKNSPQTGRDPSLF